MSDVGPRETEPIHAAILTISDRCSRGLAEDAAGPAIAELVRTELGGEVIDHELVPDETDPIQNAIRSWAMREPSPALILTVGGTGLAPRDITPEATAPLLSRRHPGLLEFARYRCYARTPLACLSRGEAGTIDRSLVINLPGSTRGATEVLGALTDIMPHAIRTLRAAPGDDPHQP